MTGVSDSAPSFGEMGEAITAVVTKSSLRSCDVDSTTLKSESVSDLTLTPAQQLVLNCVWLNLKVSIGL